MSKIKYPNPVDYNNFSILYYNTNSSKYHCKCNICGEEFDANTIKISRLIKKPKCCHKYLRAMNLVGQRIYNFTVLEPTSDRYYGYIIWLCKCDCGNIFTAPQHNIINGSIHSCGCKQYACKRPKSHKTTYIDNGNYITGLTSSNKEFIFDIDDYDLVSKYTWRVKGYEYPLLVAYVKNNNGNTISLAKVLFNIPLNKRIKVIFKNGNRFDYRKTNLEIKEY